MKEIILASNNDHKISEIQKMFNESGLDFKLVSLNDAGITEDILEPGRTFEENSMLKAYYVFMRTKKAVFADDSGLIVNALDGRPGVHSARYAGPEKDDMKNNEKLLEELSDKEDRSASFKTVITLLLEDETMHQFEGVVKGEILEENRGENGFGYDPLFKPEGFNETFAEMGDKKNDISHRKRAVEQLIEFLKNT